MTDAGTSRVTGGGSTRPAPGLVEVADAVALRIQELRASGALGADPVLLDLDPSRAVRRAPFVYDMALGRLHRVACAAIPVESTPALYALEGVTDGDLESACTTCNPVATPPPDQGAEDTADLVLGALSMLDQFGSVLRERGREYREVRRSGSLVTVVERLLGGLAEAQSTPTSSHRSSAPRREPTPRGASPASVYIRL